MFHTNYWYLQSQAQPIKVNSPMASSSRMGPSGPPINYMGMQGISDGKFIYIYIYIYIFLLWTCKKFIFLLMIRWWFFLGTPVSGYMGFSLHAGT